MPATGPRPLDLTGQRFGSWRVIRRASKPWQTKLLGTILWLCRCDCGRRYKVRSNHLRSGKSLSCVWCGNDRANK